MAWPRRLLLVALPFVLALKPEAPIALTLEPFSCWRVSGVSRSLPRSPQFGAAGRDATVRMALDISALASMPPRVFQAMVRETNAIWQPHGVSLTWIVSPVADELSGGNRLRVVPDDCPSGRVCPPMPTNRGTPRASSATRLGAVVFLDGNVGAENTVLLSVQAVDRIVEEAQWANRRVAGWPPSVRAELTGRVLGRVVAHEMGHYLVAWRAHTPDGLMRAAFRADQLIDPNRRGFDLSPSLMPRLRARLAQLSVPGATLAEAQ